MNSTTPETHDNFERRLGDSLHGHLAPIGASVDLTAPAIERSRGLRRRQAVVRGAGAALAVLAIAAPIAWNGLRTGPDEIDPGPVAPPQTTSAPSPSRQTTASTSASAPPPSAAQTTRPGPAPTYSPNSAQAPEATLSFGSRTGSAEVAYAAGGVFHDGSRTVRLPVSSGIRYVARLADGGVLVFAPAEGRAKPLYLLDATGSPRQAPTEVADVRVSHDGTRIAVADNRGTVTVLDHRGDVKASLDTRDENVSVAGFVGDTLYLNLTAAGAGSVHAWRLGSEATTRVTSGRAVDIHPGTSLAIVWPDQDYNPDNTCHRLYDLKLREVRYTSCGMFAPTSFTADGTHVAGPEVADGAGASSFKIARVSDARIVLKALADGGAWAGSWGGGQADTLVVTLLNREVATRQALASCSAATGACTIDTDAVAVSPEAVDSMQWPLVLSDN